MSEMIERVARAIKAYEATVLLDTGSVNPTGKEYTEGKARAAIEAMREPTEEVYQAGREVAMGKPGTLDSVKERWKAMIGAALNPAKVDEAG